MSTRPPKVSSPKVSSQSASAPKDAPLRRVTLDELEIEDARSFRHVALFDELSNVLRAAKYPFLVPARSPLSWDRALLLNLAFWSDQAGGDILTDASIPADVVMHVAWHHLANKHLEPSFESEILGEAIASAFDLYLVGRLLGHAPDSTFLDSQVPAMAEIAENAGVRPDDVEALLARIAQDPDRAFEDLRSLLYDVALELSLLESAEQAAGALARYDERTMGPLLHHYELATWILKGKARRDSKPGGPEGASARAVHAELQRAPSSVEWLAERWVRAV